MYVIAMMYNDWLEAQRAAHQRVYDDPHREMLRVVGQGAGLASMYETFASFMSEVYAMGEGASLIRLGLASDVLVTESGMTHILERHTAAGIRSASKSIFFEGTDLPSLARSAGRTFGVMQRNGRLIRVVGAERSVGVDVLSGEASQIYTVVTEGSGELVTMFPGFPGGL